jgi:hypothetical protein
MRARRSIAAAAAAGLLALLVFRRNSPEELARRVEFLERFSGREAAVRRLGGSSAAFDRAFFRFIESARRTLPSGCAGVALYTPAPGESQLYLACYVLAPVPVRMAPRPVPRGWTAAIYGPAARPPGWTVVRKIPGGVLMRPESRPL